MHIFIKQFYVVDLFTATEELSVFGTVYSSELSYRLGDQHMLLSIFESPVSGKCPRAYRLLGFGAALYTIVILNTFWYGSLSSTHFENLWNTSLFEGADAAVCIAVAMIAFVVTQPIFEIFRCTTQEASILASLS